jgi:putative redox protein
MYARRKNWPLEDLDVQVKITKEGKESEIERHIHFVGDLTAEQHQRLLEIADKCPVSKLLESQIRVVTAEIESEI